MDKKQGKGYKYSVRLNTSDSVRRYLARVINQLNNDEISSNKARNLGYLLNILVGIIEISDLEERIMKLEKQTETEINKQGGF